MIRWIRWIGVVGMVVVSLGAAGCNNAAKEIAPVKSSEEKSIGDPKERAMSGMPDEMRKKYQDKMNK
ncbi:MAG: hypothetical protein ACKO5R_07540 [Planctomycetaceae bacterium]